MESVNFEAPLLTELRPETEQARLGPWTTSTTSTASSQNKNEEMEDLGDLNLALDEALENYDLATSWMETDGDKEVVRK